MVMIFVSSALYIKVLFICIPVFIDKLLSVLKLQKLRHAYMYLFIFSVCHKLATTKEDEEWIETLLSLLNQPSLQLEENVKSVLDYLLDEIFQLEQWSKVKLKLSAMLPYVTAWIDKSNYIIEIESNLTEKLSIQSFSLSFTFNTPIYIEPISYTLQKFRKSGKFCYVKNLTDYLQILLKHGPSVSETPKDCVSPLTTFLLLLSDIFPRNKNTITTKKLLGGLLEKKANFESSSLEFKNFTVEGFDVKPEIIQTIVDRMNNLKQNSNVPDALVVAFLQKNVYLVELLLDYWWGPPLAILPFIANPELEHLDFWFPVLMKYGGIPHGTPIYETYMNFMLPIHQYSTINFEFPGYAKIAQIYWLRHMQMLCEY